MPKKTYLDLAQAYVNLARRHLLRARTYGVNFGFRCAARKLIGYAQGDLRQAKQILKRGKEPQDV